MSPSTPPVGEDEDTVLVPFPLDPSVPAEDTKDPETVTPIEIVSSFFELSKYNFTAPFASASNIFSVFVELLTLRVSTLKTVVPV